MRIWPESSHNGSVFFNYVPIQEKGWSIEPGQAVTMRYRVIVSDGKPNKSAIAEAFENYVGKSKKKAPTSTP